MGTYGYHLSDRSTHRECMRQSSVVDPCRPESIPEARKGWSNTLPERNKRAENRGTGVCGLDRTRKTACPSCDTGVDGPAPCPFCGCRDHVKENITANPRVHTVHQCLKCGHWFDDRGAACPRCGSPGELLGNVDVPGCGIYAQYRCRRCSHGFMLKIRENTDGHGR